MSARCGAQHPSLPVTCEAPARYPNHDHHFAVTDDGNREWENPHYITPPSKRDRKLDKEIRQAMDKTAREVRKEPVEEAGSVKQLEPGPEEKVILETLEALGPHSVGEIEWVLRHEKFFGPDLDFEPYRQAIYALMERGVVWKTPENKLVAGPGF